VNAWDVETDADNPQPNIWPECMEVDKKTGFTCLTPWVWRLGHTMSGGVKWAWMRDCKHKNAQPELMTVDGAYRPDGDE
jgi:hypothetical protein